LPPSNKKHPPPEEDSCSFYNLVGAGEQRLWHGEAQHLGGIEIDHKLEVGRLLDWQIGRFVDTARDNGQSQR
jgi:hypothetical protein